MHHDAPSVRKSDSPLGNIDAHSSQNCDAPFHENVGPRTHIAMQNDLVLTCVSHIKIVAYLPNYMPVVLTNHVVWLCDQSSRVTKVRFLKNSVRFRKSDITNGKRIIKLPRNKIFFGIGYEIVKILTKDRHILQLFASVP